MKDIAKINDFQKLDLRVGKVLKAERVKESDHLIRLTVDFGTDYPVKKILSGIAKWYNSNVLIGKQFIFVANLEPKAMMGEQSSGMVLCFDLISKAKLIKVPISVPVGTVIR